MTKSLRIEPVPESSLVRIAWEGGGSVPTELEGMWTNATVAQERITAWRAANPDRDVPEARVVPRGDEQKPSRPKTFSSLK